VHVLEILYAYQFPAIELTTTEYNRGGSFTGGALLHDDDHVQVVLFSMTMIVDR